jgi:ribosomal-protein-alanine N-acetyltransferase
MIISNATHKDLAQIMQVELNSFAVNIRETRSVFEERISLFNDGFLVIKDEDKIVGYICSEIWNIQSNLQQQLFTLGHSISESHNPQGNHIYISSMGVLQQYRKQGLGNVLFCRLLSQLTQDFSNLTSAVLIVGEAWSAARKIYIKYGFEEVFKLYKFFNPLDHPSFNGIVKTKKLK